MVTRQMSVPEPVFWMMERDDGWYAALDDEKIGPFRTREAALQAAADRGWPVEQIAGWSTGEG